MQAVGIMVVTQPVSATGTTAHALQSTLVDCSLVGTSERWLTSYATELQCFCKSWRGLVLVTATRIATQNKKLLCRCLTGIFFHDNAIIGD